MVVDGDGLFDGVEDADVEGVGLADGVTEGVGLVEGDVLGVGVGVLLTDGVGVGLALELYVHKRCSSSLSRSPKYSYISGAPTGLKALISSAYDLPKENCAFAATYTKPCCVGV